jgi:hypothetical protein
MLRNDDFQGTHVDYETFRSLAHPVCGRHNLADEETNTFAGSVRLHSVSGLTAVDIRSNARRVERTQQDVRLDGVDQYKAVFQIEGRSKISQNDRVVQLAVGGVALVDLARPVTHVSDDVDSRWLCLLLPRGSSRHANKKQASRYATYRSSLRRAALPAPNTSIRFV